MVLYNNWCNIGKSVLETIKTERVRINYPSKMLQNNLAPY